MKEKRRQDSALHFRIANEDDLQQLIEMLADDPLGKEREAFEHPLPQPYHDAFRAISGDPNNELVVATHNDDLAGFMQLTFIPYLTYRGRWRALVEGVRVHRTFRSRGFGTQMFQWAIQRAKERNCHLIQLTSVKKRPKALRFYESLGFVASHEGFKLHF